MCQIPERSWKEAFQAMADNLRRIVALDAAVIRKFINDRETQSTLSLGRGLALGHIRTDKVSQLVVSLATTREPLSDVKPIDGEPIRFVVLFLIPRKHTDLYLRVMALLFEKISDSSNREKLLSAETQEEIVAALAPSVAAGEDDPGGEVLALLSSDGRPNEHVRDIMKRSAPADVADLLEDLMPDQRAKCLRAVEPKCAAEIVSHMRPVPLGATLRRLGPEPAAHILDHLPVAKSVDILQRMDTAQQTSILRHLNKQERREIQTVLHYPPHTAGGVMSPEVLSAPSGLSVTQAGRRVADFPDRRQTDLYVVSDNGRLEGYCQLQDLLVAERDQSVDDLTRPCPRVVDPYHDQEDLRRLMSRDNLHSIPVVDRDNELIGVVTQDHLLDVVEQEASEDVYSMVGMEVVDPLHTPLMARVRMRIPWLFLTLGGELFIALVITKIFQPTLQRAVVLAAFIPAIMATGGNVGLQATTMVVRGLGVGSLKARHMRRIILTEVRLGVLLGLACGTVAASVAYLINWEHHEVIKISIAVFVAMMSATLATSFVGTVEPLLLHRLKMDPAAACGPFVTMFNDIFGSLVYMLIATLMHFSQTPPP